MAATKNGGLLCSRIIRVSVTNDNENRLAEIICEQHDRHGAGRGGFVFITTVTLYLAS